MYLKTLTLRGFKSFANPTTFAFEPGVTAVVGPNGSGKSNVVDALAWVMGEQGAKSLRGGKMEDVIFAGTAQRGPLGRAEVTLTIDNSDGALPIEYTEVSIRRTLFRNGGSEYAINGAPARLLDVQELLSDSGLGREMHVIVGQGQLDAVLRATPEERRGFIEEAAGILKHRRRKEKTVRKLANMQGNLDRLADLQTELRRQLTPLGRQAQLAREAQSIAAVVRDAQARLLADDLVAAETRIIDLTAALADRHGGDTAVQDALVAAEARVAELEAGHLGDEVDTARRTLADLESVLERFRTLRALASGRLSMLGDEEAAPVRALVSPTDVAAALAEVERLRALVPAAEEAWRVARSGSAQARTALDAADADLAAQTGLLSQRELRISTLTERARSAQATAHNLREATERRAAAARAAATRVAYAEAAVAALGPDEVVAESGAEDDAEALVLEAEAALVVARDALDHHTRDRDGHRARASALDAVLVVRDGAADLARADVGGIGARVADAVRVQPGFEVAVAAALGGAADALLAADSGAAARAAARVRADDLGRVGLLLDVATSPVPDLPGLTRLTDVLTAAPAAVRSLLTGTFLAPDLRTALDAASSALIVTEDGDLVRGGLVLTGATGGAARLEHAAERDAAVAAAERLDAVVAEHVLARDAAQSALSLARTDRDEQRARLRAAAAERSARVAERARVHASVASARAEHERLVQSAATDAATVTETAAEARRAQDALDAARSAPEPIIDTALRDTLRTDLDRARDVEADARLAAETGRERVRVAAATAERLAGELEAQRAAADAQARRTVLRRARRAHAQAVLDAAAPIAEEIQLAVAEARVLVRDAERRRTENSRELTELRAEAHRLRDRRDAAREQSLTLEIHLGEARVRAEGLSERAVSELALDPDILRAEYGPDVPVPIAETDGDEVAVPFRRAEQERRFQRARSQLAKLGQINPLALEEFAALEQRHGFLTEQLADLTRTRADLRTIIADLDEKMETIFTSAFEDTRAAFTRIFPILFPGGDGELFLTEPDDALTTGIELRVRPAGKKIERLSLLSGGERSLAAVALLVAIFTARPSPFYILDEVEAALDDANLGRLLSVFQELQKGSQLIVITHQKRTMEIADVLYGVSMRQDGVSAVVGQRLDRTE